MLSIHPCTLYAGVLHKRWKLYKGLHKTPLIESTRLLWIVYYKNVFNAKKACRKFLNRKKWIKSQKAELKSDLHKEKVDFINYA